MKVFNYIPGYFPINLRSQGRTFPQVFVKEYLLDKRFRGEIGGYLQINDLKICLPLNQKIYIGSSPHCDIFVNYPQVPKHQAYILAGEEGIGVMHLAEGGVTMLADIPEKANVNLFKPLTGRSVLHDGILAIQLLKQELPLIFEIRNNKRAVKPAFYFPENKPTIESSSQLGLEKSASPALKVNLSSSPRFASAATTFDLADIYHFHLNQIRREEERIGRMLSTVNFIYSLGAIILAMAAAPTIPFTAPIALFMFMVSTGYEKGKIRILHTASYRLNQELARIADRLSPSAKDDLIYHLKSIQLIYQYAENRDHAKLRYIDELLTQLEQSN